MSHEYFGGKMPRASAAGTAKWSGPTARRGVPHAGHIKKLLVGQGYGYIRLADDREVYFHRADVQEGTSINDFAVGDAVAFELFEDSVSGARALNVKPRRPKR